MRKYITVAVSTRPGCDEECALWDDVVSFGVDLDGTLHLTTADDSSVTYLEDEWVCFQVIKP